ncbi:hypothetical protein HDU90_001624 [Geranomyces variabilis]|nr:hypothetical protein HDU90_001624 [Geranomyces variabilis]
MAMAASYVWDRNTPNAFSLGEKRYFAATIVSTVIDYLDAIHANNGNVAATPFPHARWNNWFTAGNNPTTDYGKDPRQFSNNPTMQAATFGLTMDAARSTRGSVAHCGCEVAAGVPLLQLHGTKMHFQPWTYQPAAECSTFVGKEVGDLIKHTRASMKQWAIRIPGSHPSHARCTRLMQELESVAKTMRAFRFTGAPLPGTGQASPQPCLYFVCLVHSHWVIVGVMDANSCSPTNAETVADAGFTMW